MGRRFPYTSCVRCMITKGVYGLGGHGKHRMVLLMITGCELGFLSISYRLFYYQIPISLFLFVHYTELPSFF